LEQLLPSSAALPSPGGKRVVIDSRWDRARSKNEAYLVWDIVCRELVQHFSSQSSYNTLSGLPSTTGAVLRLDGQDGVQTTVGPVALVAEEDREKGLEQW